MLGYIIPSIVYFATFKTEFMNFYQMWIVGSSEYEPSLLKRLSIMKQFVVPAILGVFGTCILFIGLSTIMYHHISK